MRVVATLVAAAVLASSTARAEGTATATAAAYAAPPCPSSETVEVCAARRWVQATRLQTAAKVARAQLDECRDARAAGPAVVAQTPSEVTVRFETPKWVWWVVGGTLAVGAAATAYSVVRLNEALP